MPLRWDPLLVRHLARELDAALGGAHARALRLEGAARTLTLLLREATLAWDLHPAGGAVRVLPPADPAPGDLPLPGRVRRVSAPPDERILTVELLAGRGAPPRDLVVELLGNQWNALVVERPSGVVRHVLVRRERPRPARVGLPYAPPAPSAREGARAPIPLARWREILEAVPPPARVSALVEAVAWTSPLNAPALVDADPDPGVALALGHALWVESAFGEAPPRPVLLRAGDRGQPYPFPLPGVEVEAATSLLEALARWAAEGSAARAGDPAGGAGGGPALPPDLVRALERIAEGAARRATRLEAEQGRTEDPAALRGLGDRIVARLREVPAGAARATLAGFLGEEVQVALDPTLPPQENAAAYYERAARAERARERLPGLVAEARAKALALEGLLARARAGTATAEELRAALPGADGGAGEAPTRGSPRAGAAGRALPYRAFRSSGGLEIRVGRGARLNDELTFRHAAPGDVWMHARHAQGAHVILRWGREGNPPARDLEEAAVLAALHSKARTSGVVPVDWTLRRHVRKARGAAPGAVVPERVKTVMVRPDRSVAARLGFEGE